MDKKVLEEVLSEFENYLLTEIKYGSLENEEIYKEVFEKLKDIKKEKESDEDAKGEI